MKTANKELQLAHDFVDGTNCNIFLTGKAGTGKTTFLHNLKKTTPKRLIVTAPTGVAAINAGGVTLHSFFQMPFGPFVPGQESNDYKNHHRFNKEKINIIKSLDLLVIDEISMVRADLLDGIDSVLRRHRRSNQPFGGVQLLMIGDLHQLSPVVKDNEWNILQDYYDSVYFFSSNALKKTELISVELKHIYRQSDPKFIKLLNQVRNNTLDNDAFAELNKRCKPQFTTEEQDNYITLCTHNSRADAINHKRLSALAEKAHSFTAKIEGDFPQHSYPTASNLQMKKGAQVMFVRNDPKQDKLYYNGKIGQISRISAKSITIKCPDDSKEIIVEPTEWDNIKYQVDQQSNEITEQKIGTFCQYPLKLAWAITIHKSQGLTFERAVIDAQAAFAHGQVYVALSRCKTLEGMVLSTPITSSAIKTDTIVSEFSQNNEHNLPTSQQLATAQIAYQQTMIMECFDFQQLFSHFRWLLSQINQNRNIIHLANNVDIKTVEQKTITEIFKVSDNFKHQLSQLFSDKDPESDPAIKERTTKASAYFYDKISNNLVEFFEKFSFDTDNKEVRKKLNKTIKQLQQQTAIKLAAAGSCKDGFSSHNYLRAISKAELDFKPAGKKKASAVQYTEADTKHPDLFQQLRVWRSDKAAQLEVAHFQIMHQRVLLQITITLPDNLLDLVKIQGIGKVTAAKYGNELVEIVSQYRKKHGITKVVPPQATDETATQAAKNLQKTSSRHISFEMLESGLTIEQIAEKRGLVTSTIESHLSFYVEQGAIPLSTLVPADKQKIITQKLSKMPDTTLTEIKNDLGDEYSFADLRFTRAYTNFLATNQDKNVS